jgi:hypothetical protein
VTLAELTVDQGAIAELPGGPYDVEFFFDPACPFAWQTAVWIRRVQQLRDIKIGWRFISLRIVNEDKDVSASTRASHERSQRFHRICAAARDSHGNESVGDLYRSWGERFWYDDRGVAEISDRVAAAGRTTDPADVIATAGLPATLLAAGDDATWDAVVRAETEEALRRAGDDLGTPIITFGPPDGPSLFGPVISALPDDETTLKLYDLVTTLADLPTFSELKRTARAPLDLPIFAPAS